MSVSDTAPLIDDDGEVRELTDSDFERAVWTADFGGLKEAVAHLERRTQIERFAAAIGLDAAVIEKFEPQRPGFSERIAEVLKAG